MKQTIFPIYSVNVFRPEEFLAVSIYDLRRVAASNNAGARAVIREQRHDRRKNSISSGVRESSPFY